MRRYRIQLYQTGLKSRCLCNTNIIDTPMLIIEKVSRRLTAHLLTAIFVANSRFLRRDLEFRFIELRDILRVWRGARIYQNLDAVGTKQVQKPLLGMVGVSDGVDRPVRLGHGGSINGRQSISPQESLDRRRVICYHP
jgi:hypothetical protein